LINEKMSAGIYEVYKRAVSCEKPLTTFDITEHPIDIRYYVYECAPQDYWEMWNIITVSDLAYDRALFLSVWNAMLLFKEYTHWESDIRFGPAIAPIPIGDYECERIIGLKQENNGTTYFCSKVPLPIDREFFRRVLVYIRSPVRGTLPWISEIPFQGHRRIRRIRLAQSAHPVMFGVVPFASWKKVSDSQLEGRQDNALLDQGVGKAYALRDLLSR
jgi:hypothetical protein